jgi:glycerol-3-phosphate dehydrogenase
MEKIAVLGGGLLGGSLALRLSGKRDCSLWARREAAVEEARSLGIVAVDLVRGEIVLTVAESTQIDPHHLVNALTQAGSDMRVTPDHKIYGPAPPVAAGADAMFDAAHSLIGHLGS